MVLSSVYNIGTEYGKWGVKVLALPCSEIEKTVLDLKLDTLPDHFGWYTLKARFL